MSASVVSLIYRVRFGGMAAKAVAVKLADNSNDDGENIFPSKNTVADLCECSKRTVDKYMDLWIVIGLLHLDERGGGRKLNAMRRGAIRRRGRSSVYSWNMGVLRAIAEGEAPPVSAMIEDAQRRGVVDADGWAIPAVVAQIKGAPDAPFDVEDDDTESAAERVHGLHPLPDVKGCTPCTKRVHRVHQEGAPGAPEPSLNHQLTVTLPLPPPGAREKKSAALEVKPLPREVRRAEGKREAADQVIAAVRSPERQRSVDLLIEPIVRRLRIDAPDVTFALRQIADWAEKHPDAVLRDALARLLAERQASAKPADIEAALRAAIDKAKAEATLASSGIWVTGTARFRAAIEAVRRVRPLDAELMENWNGIRPSDLVKLGIDPALVGAADSRRSPAVAGASDDRGAA